MGISMNGVIADNVRVKESESNPTDSWVTVRVQIHYDGPEEVRATGDVELSRINGRVEARTSVQWIGRELKEACDRIPDPDRQLYLQRIKDDAILAARNHLVGATARGMDLSE